MLFIAACSTSPSSRVDNIYSAALNEDDLYLRGTFNWWGKQDSFKFQANTTSEWFLDVSLIGDGTVYDFKIADSTWAPQQNCGAYAEKLLLNQQAPMKLFCNSNSQNFQFIPTRDGIYRFLLNKKGDIYWLTVNKQSN